MFVRGESIYPELNPKPVDVEKKILYLPEGVIAPQHLQVGMQFRYVMSIHIRSFKATGSPWKIIVLPIFRLGFGLFWEG